MQHTGGPFFSRPPCGFAGAYPQLEPASRRSRLQFGSSAMMKTVSSRIPSAATAIWSLAAIFLLAVGSPPLQACDGGTAVPDPGNNPGLVEDCKILLGLRDELVGTGSLNWDTHLAITSWEGVGVSGAPRRVLKLELYENPLTGALPAELGRLTQLQRLELFHHQLTGGIPPELSQLTQLQYLDLSENQLTGAIPGELGQLTRLQGLRLRTNQLTREIPPELSQLTRLQALWLNENQLTGEIPMGLSQLIQLQSLYLSGNRLTGAIPGELGQLTQLANLDLSHNRLTGKIPGELGRLTGLWWIDLRENRLTGKIPVELAQLTQLGELFLSGNRLTGAIPGELGQLTQLRVLDLSHNRLTGAIPGELGRLTQLKWLRLQHNQLTGAIPGELGQLTRLRRLWLNNNQLMGAIPGELAQLSNLWELHLQHNQLTGAIPVELGRLIQLQAFSFRGNRLTGPIPPALRHLPDVYVLNLAASWVGPGQMKVTWDDPGDSTASYTYRLWDATLRTWTDWAEILETTLRASEGVTVEWTLMGLPTDVAHTYISMRARNRNGFSLEARATVGPLEAPGDTPESDPMTTLYFPDYVDGGGWSVQLAVSHISVATEDAAVLVTAYDREGQSIPGFFDFDDLFELPPLGTRVLKSSGAHADPEREFRRGWIEVKTDTASVSGLLTYRHAETGVEVSVESVELGHHFALFVEESSGIGTGLAIFKPDPASTIEFRIRDEDGVNPLGEGLARVGDFNQAARTIPEWFAMDGIDTEFLEDFRGLLFLRAEDGSSFAPIGIRFGKRGESLSSVPVIRVTGVPESPLNPDIGSGLVLRGRPGGKRGLTIER